MKKLLFGLASLALMLVAVPVERAGAVTLSSPGAAYDARNVSDSLVTEVRRGGGRGIGRGGFRGGRHFGGHRGWRGRHLGWRPRVFAPGFYGSYGPPRRCRIVMTYYGPRRVCRVPRVFW